MTPNEILAALHPDDARVWLAVGERMVGERVTLLPAFRLTVPVAAQRFGISESAVRQAIRAGRLRAERVAGTWFIDESSATEFRVARRGPRARMGET